MMTKYGGKLQLKRLQDFETADNTIIWSGSPAFHSLHSAKRLFAFYDGEIERQQHSKVHFRKYFRHPFHH